jgi:hypothetical protein
MKLAKVMLLCSLLAAGLAATALAQGKGDVKLGYVILDETGNRSVDRSTFNDYEGAAFSVENFRYDFKNGTFLRANLRNITLNNRNLTADVAKAGLFSLKLSHNQFRRIYDFHGGNTTRRHNEGAQFSFRPVQYIEVFGGGTHMARSGSTVDLFNPGPVPETNQVDYKQYFYNGGAKITYRGMMLLGEFRGNQFRDNILTSRNQDRREGRVTATVPVPRYDWIVLQGGFRHFDTRYTKTDFTISSNRAWGAAALDLPANFTFRHLVMIDRTSSDSDYTATDNIVYANYAGYTYRRLFGATIGFQHDLNDQYFKEIQGNSWYGSGWVKPIPQTEFRFELGSRVEDVKEGVHLIGNEDLDRYKISGKYKYADIGNLAVRYESKIRKNNDIGSKVTLNRATVDCGVTIKKYGTVTAGYSYGKGDYQNATRQFKFADHLLYGNAMLNEYKRVTLGGGATYYRSKRDLDVESFNVRFTAAFRFYDDLRLEGTYNAYNFDDFLVQDQYYTANIVEINLIKGISF